MGHSYLYCTIRMILAKYNNPPGRLSKFLLPPECWILKLSVQILSSWAKLTKTRASRRGAALWRRLSFASSGHRDGSSLCWVDLPPLERNLPEFRVPCPRVRVRAGWVRLLRVILWLLVWTARESHAWGPSLSHPHSEEAALSCFVIFQPLDQLI